MRKEKDVHVFFMRGQKVCIKFSNLVVVDFVTPNVVIYQAQSCSFELLFMKKWLSLFLPSKDLLLKLFVLLVVVSSSSQPQVSGNETSDKIILHMFTQT